MGKRRWRSILLVLACCLPLCAFAGSGAPAEGDLIWPLMQAETLEESDKETAALQESRSQLVTSLIIMLRRSPNREEKIRICFLLGEYRATEAVVDLAEHITLREEITKDIIGTPRWHFYPAQEALAKCGARSIPYMVRTLETSDDEEVRKLSAGVITMIMGQALGTPVEAKTHARLIVEAAMRKQPDQVKKARLKAALSYFKLSRLTQPTDNK